MAPVATTETVVDTTQRIGQLKLNAAASTSAAPVQAQKQDEKVRVVDPFNYVVSPISALSCLQWCQS